MQSFLVVSSVLLWGVVLFNLLLTLAVIKRVNDNNKQIHDMGMPDIGLKPGTQAPDFAAQTLDGETVTLANYKGRKVGFLYVSPHCSPCKEKIPFFQALYTNSQQIGLDWLLVSVAGTRDDTQAMIADFEITMPVLFAPRETNPLAQDYQANGTPSYCLVGEDGKVLLSGYPDTEVNASLQKKLEEWGIGKGGDV
jgi:peroxiredoxin